MHESQVFTLLHQNLSLSFSQKQIFKKWPKHENTVQTKIQLPAPDTSSEISQGSWRGDKDILVRYSRGYSSIHMEIVRMMRIGLKEMHSFDGICTTSIQRSNLEDRELGVWTKYMKSIRYVSSDSIITSKNMMRNFLPIIPNTFCLLTMSSYF
jgi:hypothetical protein